MSLRLGGYTLLFELASGGMGTVHLARHRAAGGVERLVAVKRIHPHLASAREFADMLLDEARLASQIRSPHVVPVDDVVDAGGELLLVQPYIEAVSLAALLASARESGERLPARVAVRILGDVLAGLDGAHHARDLRGEPLGIVHRDVSPANVLVGADGRSRVIDFGIARAARRITVTQSGVLKGKVAYMAPEALRRTPIDARADVFSAGVVLYEALTGARPFEGEDEGDTLLSILIGDPDPPSERAPELPPAVDAVARRALAVDRAERYASAADLGAALEEALPPAPPREVAEVVARLCGAALSATRSRAREILDADDAPPPSGAPLLAPHAPPVAPGDASTVAPSRIRRGMVAAIAVTALASAVAAHALTRAPSPPLPSPPSPAASLAVEPPPPSTPPSAPAPIASAQRPAPSVRPPPPRRAPDRPAASAPELHPNPYADPR